jgi:hypothetical protein
VWVVRLQLQTPAAPETRILLLTAHPVPVEKVRAPDVPAEPAELEHNLFSSSDARSDSSFTATPQLPPLSTHHTNQPTRHRETGTLNHARPAFSGASRTPDVQHCCFRGRLGPQYMRGPGWAATLVQWTRWVTCWWVEGSEGETMSQPRTRMGWGWG